MGLFERLTELLPGQGGRMRLGKYRIIRRLAEGGMGEIFLARSHAGSGFEKVVVLKRILQHNMRDAEAVRMFLDEARLMATLNHPNIVQVYDFGTARGTPFFTMEYVHGEDLGHIAKAAVTAGRVLPLEFAIGVIADAAAALHYAHEKRGRDGHLLQLVHRDVSPSNVLVSYDGAVKLTDFGIAKWAKRETETRYGALKGKIAYMSPEQCKGSDLDRRSDLFGLGILLYELSTGTRLFQGTSDFAILDQIVNGEIAPPSSRRPDYPYALEQIVMRALSRDADRRFATAREMQLALEELALEARLMISPVARAAEMEALFDQKIGAWREAAQAGRSLGQHLAEMGPAVPFAPTIKREPWDGTLDGTARTRTRAENGLATMSRPPAVAPPKRGPGRFVAAGVLAGAVGLAAVVAMQQRGARLRPAAATAAEAPAPIAPAPEIAPPSPEPAIVPLPDTVAVETLDAQADPTPGKRRAAFDVHKRSSRDRDPKRAAKAPRTSPGAAKAKQDKKVWDPDSVFLP